MQNVNAFHLKCNLIIIYTISKHPYKQHEHKKAF